jgi:hypothetical protein
MFYKKIKRALISLAVLSGAYLFYCNDGTGPVVAVPGPVVHLRIESSQYVLPDPGVDCITQASSEKRINIYYQVDPLADSTDSINGIYLNYTDGGMPDTLLKATFVPGEWTPIKHWWIAAGICTTTLVATTAKGGFSDSSLCSYVYTGDDIR